MFFILLSGCGLFHEADIGMALPRTDDTGLVGDTGILDTDTDTDTDTNTGGNLSLNMALYAMTVTDQDSIEIATFDLNEGSLVDTTSTYMTGDYSSKSTGDLIVSSQGLFTSDGSLLLATGSTDRFLYGFFIGDDSRLQENTWSPHDTDFALFTLAESDDHVYGASVTGLEAFELQGGEYINQIGSKDLCEVGCSFFDVVARRDRDGFIAIHSMAVEGESRYSYRSLVMLDPSISQPQGFNDETLFYGLERIVKYGNDEIIYAPTQTEVVVIGSEPDLMWMGTIFEYDIVNLAVSPDNSTVHAITSLGELRTFEVSQGWEGAMFWNHISSNSTPNGARNIYASQQYLAIGGTNSIWVYDFDSNGGTNNLVAKFSAPNNRFFGPMVIVENVGGN